MKIGIVNDMPLAVEALRRALAARHDFEVLWIAQDGQQAVDFCTAQRPDIVLMDLVMPNVDGDRGHAPHHGARAVRDPDRYRRCGRERVARL